MKSKTLYLYFLLEMGWKLKHYSGTLLFRKNYLFVLMEQRGKTGFVLIVD